MEKKHREILRGICIMPHDCDILPPRLAVFTDAEGEKIAREEKVEVIGTQELADSIMNGGPINFDWCISTNAGVPLLKPLGPILGPKGLMPTPKLRTLVPVNQLRETINLVRKSLIHFR